MNRLFVSRIVFIVFIVFVFILALGLFRAPKPEPMNLVKERFSVDRAFSHIEQIAKCPHAMATNEHERVKQYIIDELQKLDLETSVQSTTSMYDFRGSVSAGYIHNVIGVLKGREEGKSILITAHYDSQPNTLGAADDGAAIGAMIEAARALKAYPQLQNDVIFLFSDGEEAGLFGAKAFAEQHPLMDNVGLVLNLEARGSSGPSYTFEMSSDNGWIVKEFIKAVRYPVASSLAYEVYKLLSNNSDFTIYKNAGYSGFNAAFIENYVDYHSLTDSPQKLSKRSLQHHGSYIMDISKHFGELDLSETKAPDVVFFNWLAYKMIWYPQSWNIFLLIIACLLFVIILTFGILKKKLKVWKMLLGILVFLVTIALSLGGVWLMQKGIKANYPWYENFYDANFYNVPYYFMAFAAFCLTIISAVYALLYKKLGMINLWVAVLFVSIIISFIIQMYIPTGLFVTLLPLFLFQIAIIVKFYFNFKFEQKRYLLLIALLSFPVITTFMPFVKILYITFGLGMAIGGSLVFVLLLTYLLPVFEVVFNIKRWWLALLSFATVIFFFVLAHYTSDYNENRPLQSDIVYCQDAQTNQSLWVSSTLELDRWNQQFFNEPNIEALTEIYPHASQLRVKNKAPFVNIEHPELSITADTIIDSLRHVKFNLRSIRGAENAQFFIHKDAAIRDFKINGLGMQDEDFYTTYYGDHHYFNFYGVQEEGIEIEITCGLENSIKLIMIEKKLGLPQFKQFESMPDYIVPQAGYTSNMTILRKDWEI